MRLVAALAATGSRFSQITRCQVADLQAKRLMVPASRKGRSGGKPARVAALLGDDVLALLRPAAAGRPLGAPLFERWWHQMRGGHPPAGQAWPMDAGGQAGAPWAKILAEAGLPNSTLPYTLRHSSICRMLRQGLPVRLVAAIHDSSSEMLERALERCDRHAARGRS